MLSLVFVQMSVIAVTAFLSALGKRCFAWCSIKTAIKSVLFLMGGQTKGNVFFFFVKSSAVHWFVGEVLMVARQISEQFRE
jgi:hypothetical protein